MLLYFHYDGNMFVDRQVDFNIYIKECDAIMIRFIKGDGYG